jgi:hypothetical protein
MSVPVAGRIGNGNIGVGIGSTVDVEANEQEKSNCPTDSEVGGATMKRVLTHRIADLGTEFIQAFELSRNQMIKCKISKDMTRKIELTTKRIDKISDLCSDRGLKELTEVTEDFLDFFLDKRNYVYAVENSVAQSVDSLIFGSATTIGQIISNGMFLACRKIPPPKGQCPAFEKRSGQIVSPKVVRN